MSKYLASGGDLFEDEVDDEEFLKNSSKRPAIRDDRIQSILQKKHEIENRTLESTENSLRMLNETEVIGIQTAEELSVQREKLENTNRNLDEINNSLRHSQKHINGIKSIFGGLKNYFSGNNNKLQGQPISEASSNSIPSNNNSEVKQEKSSFIPPVTSPSPGAMLQKKAPRNVFEDRLASNLDAMCDNLSRLKGLAEDLNGEIETQNNLIDDMVYKSESVEIKMGKQQKDIDRLLKK
ncbi:SNAP29 family protein [Megaselia abdita]